ncbi:hypothetical protein NIES2101_38090 [Calothrix sp. HK-06]|nr:hypothetical protein NIES2101_38090 [Calothrix sp. HK-06]
MNILNYLYSQIDRAFEILLASGIDDINYLLQLLLFKRLSDMFEDEDKAKNTKNSKYNLVQDKSYYSFFLPQGCRWVDVMRFERKIGERLDEVLNEIENNNPRLLQEIFNNRKWNTIPDETLKELIDFFSIIDFKNSNLTEKELFGYACEYLITKDTLRQGLKGGDSTTPKSIAKLLVGLIEPQENMRICDPVCGVGGFLVECMHQIKLKGYNLDNVFLYGQDRNIYTYTNAKINLLLHDIYNFDIRLGDTLLNPQFVDNEKLMRFDRIVANPPLNLNDWNYDRGKNDIYNRFRYGLPPLKSADFAFFQHIIATLNETGRASVITLRGALSRRGAEETIRNNIIKHDLIEAVIELAPNLLYGSAISAVILVFNRNKTEERKDKIIFIDASNKYEKSKNQYILSDENINDILSAYQNFENQEGYTKVVSTKELANNDYINLNVNQYVKSFTPHVDIKSEISKEISKLKNLEVESAKLSEEINESMRALGINI